MTKLCGYDKNNNTPKSTVDKEGWYAIGCSTSHYCNC